MYALSDFFIRRLRKKLRKDFILDFLPQIAIVVSMHNKIYICVYKYL